MAKENFEQYLHAFASLVSMEKQGCEINSNHQTVCVINEEAGWEPLTFFKLYGKLLNNMATQPIEEELCEFIRKQSYLCDGLARFQSTYPTAHIDMILASLEQRGNYVLYPWGTSDHQVYFDLWRTQGNFYAVTIYDLGAGRTGETVRTDYQPIQHTFETKQAFVDYLNAVITQQNAVILDKGSFQQRFNITYRGTEEDYDQAFEAAYNQAYSRAATKFYSHIYGVRRNVCESCVPEKPQTTGNCVVKNLLAAAKQDAIYEQGEEAGSALFREFYLLLIRTTLEMAKNHADQFLDRPLPPIQAVCSHIQKSQESFTGVNCEDIHGAFADLYQEISDKAKKNQQRPRPSRTRPYSPMWSPKRSYQSQEETPRYSRA